MAFRTCSQTSYPAWRSGTASRRWGVLAVVAWLPGRALAAGGSDDPLMDLIYQAGNFLLLLGIIFFVARKPVMAYLAGRR